MRETEMEEGLTLDKFLWQMDIVEHIEKEDDFDVIY